MPMRQVPDKFLVAFSFAGDQRVIVRPIAEAVEAVLGRGTVFFDEWFEHFIGGADADLKLQAIYGEKSALVVVCVSGRYGGKPWPRAEHEAIRARLMHARASEDPRERDSIFPIRVGDGDVPGILFNTIVLDVRARPPDETATLIIERLRLIFPDIKTERWSNPETASPVNRRICKLACRDNRTDVLHFRAAHFLVCLCSAFPKTQFRIVRHGMSANAEAEIVDPKNLLGLILGGFKDGEEVTLEVTGELQVMGAEFFKVSWEHLDHYSEDVTVANSRLSKLIGHAFSGLIDPDLPEIGLGTWFIPPRGSEKPAIRSQECRRLATINDRLHNLSLPMIPLIAKHFNSRLQISFELPEKGIFSFTMEPANEFHLGGRILELKVEVGTRITIAACGEKAEVCANSVRDILQNLWQCDEWIRRRAKDFDSVDVAELLQFATVMRKSQRSDYGYVQSPFISNLLTRRHVFINRRGMAPSKREVLDQLALAHARLHGLEFSSILERIEEVERKQSIVLCPGFTVAHAAMDRKPRIAIVFGTYPDGVKWSDNEPAAKLVVMVLCARDTYGTWRDVLKRFAVIFRGNLDLQANLIAAEDPATFLALLRRAETGQIKT